jgi:hypothetical protein
MCIRDRNGFGPFLGKLFNIVEQRQLVLETALAEAKGARVYRLDLRGESHVPLWQFDYTEELIAAGYEKARQELAGGSLHPLMAHTGWFARALRAIRQRLSADGGMVR